MQTRIKIVVIICSIVVMSMFGFCFALVPLYSTFCKITGINTALRVNEFESQMDQTRTIRLELIANNNANLPWIFYPLKATVLVHPGALNKIIFFAKNNSKKSMTIQAIPSFAPLNAAYYFHKIQCFCFEQQTLKPGETKYMPVIFRIDSRIPYDLSTISLAYTLFDVTQKVARTAT